MGVGYLMGEQIVEQDFWPRGNVGYNALELFKDRFLILFKVTKSTDRCPKRRNVYVLAMYI